MADATILPTQTSVNPSRASAGGSLMVWLFFLSITLPVNFMVGGLAMGPYRLYLVIVTVPFLLQLLAGKAGRVTLVDVAMILFGVWVFISLYAVHGTERIAFGGSLMIELVGGYLTGRLLVRTPAQYEKTFQIFFIILMLLLPFALFEFFTGRMIIVEVIRKFAPSVNKLNEWRMGLSRTQVVFPSSILWGLFCSFGIANLFYLNTDRLGRGIWKSALTLAMTCFSMSSGPLLSGILQTGLIVWDQITKSRWILLLVLGSITYVVVDLLSNRTPFMIFIETFTFSPGTAWARIFIWRYGTDEVWRHPYFGIGLNDWVRASWMRGSVDNFWLLTAMRHGLPAIILLLGGAALNTFWVLRSKPGTRKISQMRTAYLITVFGLFFTLSTVHAWGAVSVMVTFFIGIGACFYTPQPEDAAQVAPTTDPLTDDTIADARSRPARVPSGVSYARAPAPKPEPRRPSDAKRADPKTPRYSRQTTPVSRSRSRT
ncbi:O-antigen ligase family protein [Limimaricola litoreus]|uniref:O-antigen ligase family protein n=1 Tax=Limimaricola litoreus TaxID=2955316 RepID=A0A9X2FNB9_9RHOB|nr:O-antigen ligase family protein [Limimaricola litoreus]MCP1168397.1 O-antigen ligase family protein [Limimaricola litoreus]